MLYIFQELTYIRGILFPFMIKKEVILPYCSSVFCFTVNGEVGEIYLLNIAINI